MLRDIPGIIIISGVFGLLICLSEIILNLAGLLFSHPEKFHVFQLPGLISAGLNLRSLRVEMASLIFLGWACGLLAGLLLYPVLFKLSEFNREFSIRNTLVVLVSLILVMLGLFYLSGIILPNTGALIGTIVVASGFMVLQCYHYRGKPLRKALLNLTSQAIWIVTFLVIIRKTVYVLNFSGFPIRYLLILPVIAGCYIGHVLFRRFLTWLDDVLLRRFRLERAILILAYLIIGYVLYYRFWGYQRIPYQRHHPEGKPNIVMIVMDTVRADHVSCYGYHRVTTPFIDRLAQQGLKFENAYSTSPWTLPSHASFFTGLFPSEHQAISGNTYLEDEYQTLAESLSQQGYITLAYPCNPWISRFSNLDQGFDIIIEGWHEQSFPLLGTQLQRLGVMIFDVSSLWLDSGGGKATRTAIRWLKKLSRKKQPFFLFINYMEAHVPYPFNPETFHFLPDKENAFDMLHEIHFDWIAYDTGHQHLTKKQGGMILAWYDGCIYYIDNRIKELVQTLIQQELYSNTILVILSDHGEGLGEHDMWSHEYGIYYNLLRVPLIITYPPLIPSGLEISTPFSLKELPSMILEMQSGKKPEILYSPRKPVHLESAPLIFAERFRPVTTIQVFNKQYPDFDTEKIDGDKKSLIKFPYHFIWDSKGRDGLYRADLDPEEETNVINTETEIYQELEFQVNLFRIEHPAPVLKEERKAFDPETERKLRALGYIR